METKLPLWLKSSAANECHLFVKVVPGAKRDEICGLYEVADSAKETPITAVKIRIMSPPVDGQANKGLVEFLAKIFSLPRSAVVLLKGESSRHKTVCIARDAGTIAALIQKLL